MCGKFYGEYFLAYNIFPKKCVFLWKNTKNWFLVGSSLVKNNFPSWLGFRVFREGGGGGGGWGLLEDTDQQLDTMQLTMGIFFFSKPSSSWTYKFSGNVLILKKIIIVFKKTDYGTDM